MHTSGTLHQKMQNPTHLLAKNATTKSDRSRTLKIEKIEKIELEKGKPERRALPHSVPQHKTHYAERRNAKVTTNSCPKTINTVKSITSTTSRQQHHLTVSVHSEFACAQVMPVVSSRVPTPPPVRTDTHARCARAARARFELAVGRAAAQGHSKTVLLDPIRGFRTDLPGTRLVRGRLQHWFLRVR
jgi:hypothetical protein